MPFERELLLLLCYVFLANATQTRILVNCDRNGFVCNTINLKRLVTYQCPSGTKDIIAHLWNFGEPSNTAWILIKNCDSVEIDMSCTVYRKSFESLTIQNVTNLKFTRTVTTVKNPTKIVIRDVKNIELIPENTFSIPHMMKYNGEASLHELQEIYFERVHIGTIEGHAFHSLRGFRSFKWDNVHVDRLHANAIKIAFNTTEKFVGTFEVTNGTVEIFEYLSFQLHVKTATFSNNKIVEIMPGGINGTIETFRFTNNAVNSLRSGSISILSKAVIIESNTFENLNSGSFEKISPGLLIDSHTSFGNLEFRYKFSNNNVVYVDAGSLNPDMVAYGKVSTDFKFNFNTFLCQCDNLGWLMSTAGHGHSTANLKSFYETVLKKDSLNTCSNLNCKKTISDIQHFFENGQCNSSLNMEDFCRTTTRPPIVVSNKHKSHEVLWLNRSGKVLSSSNHFVSNSLLVIVASLFVIFNQYFF